METNCLPSVGLFIFLFQGKTHRRSVSCLLVQPSNAATLRVYFISRSIRWVRVGRNRRTLANECCSFGEASRLYQWFIPLYYLKHTSVNIYRGRERSEWDILPIYLFFAIRIHISSPTGCSLAVSVNLRSSCEYMWSKLEWSVWYTWWVKSSDWICARGFAKERQQTNLNGQFKSDFRCGNIVTLGNWMERAVSVNINWQIFD